MKFLSKIFKKKKIKKAQTKRKTHKTARTKVKKKTSQKEQLIGIVTHYFPKVKAAVIKIKKDSVSLGDALHIKGYTTDFIQKATSVQINHVPIKTAKRGAEIGLRVKSRVRANDLVYKVK